MCLTNPPVTLCVINSFGILSRATPGASQIGKCPVSRERSTKAVRREGERGEQIGFAAVRFREVGGEHVGERVTLACKVYCLQLAE